MWKQIFCASTTKAVGFNLNDEVESIICFSSPPHVCVATFRLQNIRTHGSECEEVELIEPQQLLDAFPLVDYKIGLSLTDPSFIYQVENFNISKHLSNLSSASFIYFTEINIVIEEDSILCHFFNVGIWNPLSSIPVLASMHKGKIMHLEDVNGTIWWIRNYFQ